MTRNSHKSEAGYLMKERNDTSKWVEHTFRTTEVVTGLNFTLRKQRFHSNK